jgi:hypothetical protein
MIYLLTALIIFVLLFIRIFIIGEPPEEWYQSRYDRPNNSDKGPM